MPRASGPFTIDNVEYRTDADGNITETEPAIAEIVRPLNQRVVQRRHQLKSDELGRCNAELARLEARKVVLEGELADLDTIIANAKPPRLNNR